MTIGKLFPMDGTLPHCGMVVAEQVIAEYYTDEPSPSQWVAVGTIALKGCAAGGKLVHALMVGCGRSEDSAVRDLSHRLSGMRLVER